MGGWVHTRICCMAAKLERGDCTQIRVVFQGHQDPKETKAMKGWRVNLVFPACLGCEVRNKTSRASIALQLFTQSP